ncbi:MAG TPA: S41 family peptidase [Rhizomicrobium sp.]
MALTALPFPARADMCRDGAANGQDVAWLIDRMEAHYAYLPDRHVDVAKLRAVYVAEAGAVCEPHAFLNVLERLLAEFHDHHIEADVNNTRSPQLVPTGAEAWASFQGGRAIIEAVRPGSRLAMAGARAGDEVVNINGRPAADAVAAHAPRCLSAPDPEANDYTLRVLLAGTHSTHGVFTLVGRDSRKIDLPPHAREPQGTLLTLRRIDSEIACIRIENSLGDAALVAEFDKALEETRGVRGLILDLRNTPSGGNTDVAEPILGRFIAGRPGYQRVFRPGPERTLAKDSYVRWVRERGPFRVTSSLVVLCDRWTGSMGEGMTIGLDGIGRAAVVGTRMAGLCGATEGVTLPDSRIGVNFPVERLYHLDGRPRERFVPRELVELATAGGEDPILARGIAVLRDMPR